MSDEQDLVETLALAAAEAVRARRGAIEAGGPGKLRGITVEVHPVNAGAVIESTTYLEWRQTSRRNG